jgi:DNA-binding NarL/FixJ family response regulator
MKILHADDHPLFRESLRFFLSLLGNEVRVLEASSLQAALDKLALERPVDLLLLDLEMPGMDGIEGFLAIRRRYPGLPIVIVSGVNDVQIIRSLLDSGARGYIPKFAGSEQLMDGLRRVLKGEVYVPDGLLLPPSPVAANHSETGLLTARQLQILPLLAEGMPNKRIADALALTEGTVKQHLKQLFKRLNATNRTHAVKEARRLGLLRK